MSSAISDAEWAARVELAACYRLVARFGMDDLIYNHITARAPGDDHHLLINAYGLRYSEITASNLYKIDLDGNIVTKPDLPYGINHAGYVIHGAVHSARPDVRCVIHTHTRAGVAVSAMQCGLLPISQTSLRFTKRIGYHDFEGPVFTLDERARLVENLGENDALILRNHGLLVCGRTVGETFHLIQRLEVACQVQVDVMAAGQDIHYPSKSAQESTEAMLGRDADGLPVSVGGKMEWEALVRELHRDDPTYSA